MGRFVNMCAKMFKVVAHWLETRGFRAKEIPNKLKWVAWIVFQSGGMWWMCDAEGIHQLVIRRLWKIFWLSSLKHYYYYYYFNTIYEYSVYELTGNLNCIISPFDGITATTIVVLKWYAQSQNSLPNMIIGATMCVDAPNAQCVKCNATWSQLS